MRIPNFSGYHVANIDYNLGLCRLASPKVRLTCESVANGKKLVEVQEYSLRALKQMLEQDIGTRKEFNELERVLSETDNIIKSK